MSYPKVKEFLSHVVTGTSVIIEDDLMEDHVYYEGSVGNYFSSDVVENNLTLIQSFIKDNVLYVRALNDYDE